MQSSIKFFHYPTIVELEFVMLFLRSCKWFLWKLYAITVINSNALFWIIIINVNVGNESIWLNSNYLED